MFHYFEENSKKEKEKTHPLFCPFSHTHTHKKHFLFRVIERSHVLVQVVDARDPLRYLSTDLALAAAGMPAGRNQYWSAFIELPPSGDPCLFAFSAAAVLQLLAYRMSVIKMEWLEDLGVADHGVHPDAPKNVSKSITVD